jgi:5-methylcytosine-specific restriction endonuclease McrA
MRLRSPCLDCQRLTRPGRSRCDDCTRAIRKGWDRGSVLNRQRRMRGAGGGAQRLRRKVNTQGGSSCTGCGTWHPAPSIRIDHVVPVGLGGTDEGENVQPLCLDCHRAKTRSEQSKQPHRAPPYLTT